MRKFMSNKILIDKLNNKTAIIGIVGLGYVGLPLALRYLDVGYRVFGIDIDQGKVDYISRGESYIEHIPSNAIACAIKNGFHVTTEFSNIANVDAIIICVPTPLNKYREPDISFIINTMEAIMPHLKEGQIISLESTTYPGTTDEELRPRIESVGLKIGKSTFLVFSPEREDPGNPNFTTKTIPKVCGGDTEACLEVGLALYGNVIDQVVPVSSSRAAEMTKLLENIHRAVNIGLVNEMKIIADKMGLNIHEIIRAAATKPFGFVPYYPGPGLGGHCIPIDPFYLTWKAREYGIHTRFIELAGDVNSIMPKWVVSKIEGALNDRFKSVNGSKILILGISYKKNVDDMRESPSVEMMELLKEKGAVIDYSDPHLLVFPSTPEHHFELKSVRLTPETIASFDCLVVATNHDAFDYINIKKYARLIVDTRGVYLESANNVIRA
jgi:UDP-N-acetyl-D-glucosamine dehydrogenase